MMAPILKSVIKRAFAVVSVDISFVHNRDSGR